MSNETSPLFQQTMTKLEANHMLSPSPWWNPQCLLQAESRLHRIGQTKNVYIRQFLIDNQFNETEDTIEAINILNK